MKTSDHLRNLMFTQLEALVDTTKTVDLPRARVACETGQVIVNAARAEVEYVKTTNGAVTSPFFEEQEGVQERTYLPHQPAGNVQDVIPKGETAATQAAFGFGSLPAPAKPIHPWRKDAERAIQEKQDREAGAAA